MGDLITRLPVVAKHDATVLLIGESGTGKEFIAAGIHRYSGRNGNFVKVNCAAIPEHLMESELFGHVKGAFTGATNNRQGKFMAADKGTLFLDEIATMNVEVQGKLLRSIEYGTFSPVGSDKEETSSVRIVCACHRADLETRIKKGSFLVDLYYRISTYVISIPPLRDRKEDLPRMVHYFFENVCKKMGVAEIYPDAYQKILNYPWPGNLRELRSALTAASINARSRNSDAISIDDLDIFPSALLQAMPEKSRDIIESWLASLYSGTISMHDIDREARRLVLLELKRKEDGSAARIAKVLGKSESAVRTLYSKAGLRIRND